MALNGWTRLRTRVGIGGVAIAGIIAAALLFILVNVVHEAAPAQVNTARGKQFPCTVLNVFDGDGPIACSEKDQEGKQVVVRLRGIEAREQDNKCPRADLCPAASGEEAKAALTRLAVGRLQCTSFGPSYTRVNASCLTPTGADLSCEMVRTGTAVRWPEYDPEGRLKHCLPAARPATSGAR
ncbi:MAG TPA: hypothetical protein VF662_01805 [Allosphingosinicella sp.]|jgi:endonuclease YncB( thermonuclease family)